MTSAGLRYYFVNGHAVARAKKKGPGSGCFPALMKP